ncbi:MAG TPA: hypothetical protein VK324_08575 [Tepidisphaeraceae bacterium]|nr:hypothetical protein [Tepidisphaeraceae bacterium]
MRLPAFAAVLLGCLAAPVPGAVITSEAAMPSGAAVIDFAPFASLGGDGWLTGPGPVQVGAAAGRDVTWSSNSKFALLGNGSYGLLGNGDWGKARGGFAAVNGEPGAAITFTFHDGPVGAVGGFVNYGKGTAAAALVLAALGSAGEILESVDVAQAAPVHTPHQTGGGAFRGLLRDANDIHAFRVSGAFGVLDNLTFATAVPEPATAAVAVAAGTALLLRRRKGRGTA